MASPPSAEMERRAWVRQQEVVTALGQEALEEESLDRLIHGAAAIERHDGDIWVDSEPGEGSTFSFTLPEAPEIDG